MISKDEFLSKVKAEIFPKLIQEEKKRIWALLKGSFLALIGVVIFVSFIDFKAETEAGHDSNGAVVSFLFAFLVSGASIWEHYAKKQKSYLSPIFFSFLNLSYAQTLSSENSNFRLSEACQNSSISSFDKNFSIDENLVKYSGLFAGFVCVVFDDCFSGIFENTRFSVAEMGVAVARGKYELNPSDLLANMTNFSGVCIDIPMKKNVSGYTLLFNTKLRKSIPVLQKVTLEDELFNKEYQVFSDNQIEVRTLLTPAFIERLNNLKKCFKNKRIDVSFFANHAFFAIYTKEELFEAYSFFKSGTNIKTYSKFYDDVKAIYDITEILNINNKNLPENQAFKETFLAQTLYKQISPKRKKLTVPVFLGYFFLFTISLSIIVYFVLQFFRSIY